VWNVTFQDAPAGGVVDYEMEEEEEDLMKAIKLYTELKARQPSSRAKSRRSLASIAKFALQQDDIINWLYQQINE
jgi:hypothetical protein